MLCHFDECIYLDQDLVQCQHWWRGNCIASLNSSAGAETLNPIASSPSYYFKLTVLNLPRKRSLAKGTFVKGFLISSRNSGSVCGFTSATSVAKQRSPCAWIAFLWLLHINWLFVNLKICLYTENDIVKIALLFVPGLSGQLCER